MELEIIESAKKPEDMTAGCCGSDIWFVQIPQ